MASQLNRSDLQPYQHRCIELIKERSVPGCAMWAQMGLGKTITALTAVSDLIDEYETRRVLVIAPLRVARKVWTDEIQKWEQVSHLRTAKIIGDEPTRAAAIRQRADIYTINRENVAWLVEQHFNRVKQERGGVVREVMGSKQIRPWIWDTVIIDEATSFKSIQATRWMRLRRARKLFPRLIELTGTPSPNGYMDLWPQVYLMDQGQRLGTTITAYRDRWFEKPEKSFKYYAKSRIIICPETGEDIIDPWAVNQIKDRLADICFSLRTEDYLDIKDPEKKIQKAYLSPDELAHYKEMERHAVMELDGEEITAVNAGVLSNKLVQLANGAIYTEHPKWVEFHQKKLDVLEEMLSVASGPTIVTYYFQHDYERITKRLKRMKANWRPLDTEQDEDDWNAGKVDVLVLHPESAGHGLNLQGSGSELIIWFGLTFNLEHYQQVVARLGGGHRLAGRNLVVQHIIADGTRDEEILEILADKDAEQDDLTRYMSGLIRKSIPGS